MAERRNLASSLSKGKAGELDQRFWQTLILLTTSPSCQRNYNKHKNLLSRVETSVAKVGLKMNSGKTKFMSYNLSQVVTLKTNDGTAFEEVSDFKYLGAWMASTEKDIKMRKGAAWRACSKLTKIWKSTSPKQLKHRIFAATVDNN